MKSVEAEFVPGEGIRVKESPLAWFATELAKVDLVDIVGAVIVLVHKNGDVQFLHQEDEKLLVLGALDVARETLVNDFIDVPKDGDEDDIEEEEDDEDD